MRLFTGDECGLLKEVLPEMGRKKDGDDDPFKKKVVVVEEGIQRMDPNERQSRSRGVVDMSFTTNMVNNNFAALRVDGSIEFWEEMDQENPQEQQHGELSFGEYRRVRTTQNIFKPTEREKDDDDTTTKTTNQVSSDKVGRPMALACWARHDSLLCAANSLGQLTLLKNTGSIVAQYNAFSQQHKKSNTSYSKVQFGYEKDVISAMACDPIQHGRIAVGGRDRETTLLDMNSNAAVLWKAKNLPPDPQTLLQQPIWSTALLFLQDSNLLAVGTAYQQVRLYDVRQDSTSRRPLSYTSEGALEHRVTALCQVSEYGLVVGDTAGYLHDLDIRKLGKAKKSAETSLGGRYVGPSGSIRQIAKHPTLPIMGVVGLDRMLRIYNTTNRKSLHCVYLKQRLNCLLFSHNEESEPDYSNMKESEIYEQQDNVQDYVDSDQEQESTSSHSDKQLSSEDDSDDASSNGSTEEESNSEEDSDDEEIESYEQKGSNKRRKR